jgi:hypothetical protein
MKSPVYTEKFIMDVVYEYYGSMCYFGKYTVQFNSVPHDFGITLIKNDDFTRKMDYDYDKITELHFDYTQKLITVKCKCGDSRYAVHTFLLTCADITALNKIKWFQLYLNI